FYPSNVPAFMLLGMGAVLAAATNTPVATTILLLEISHSFDLLIPLAICVCVAYLVGAGTSLYEGQRVTRDDEVPGFYPQFKIHSSEVSKPTPPPSGSPPNTTRNRDENSVQKRVEID
ncbi:MAG: chloride channel protein, partial [Candidatus Thorarchaeota archaeon]|nr:chloride channel protein [Candidatus Thorarchaeota archaeon]